jgi:hypothetical protein
MYTPEQLTVVRDTLITTYAQVGLWGERQPSWPVPEGVERSSDVHLAYLTLVYTISGGRDPVALWQAARETFTAVPTLFDPHTLAHQKPADLIEPLQAHGLLRKAKSEATIWQRLGQALVMRAGGSVKKLLADHDNDTQSLLAMLARSKATFLVLSGAQTAPRWLYGLAHEGQQPLHNREQLVVPNSPAVTLALAGLEIEAKKVSAAVFAPLDALGRLGCRQRRATQLNCPAARQCPVAQFCQYGRLQRQHPLL